MSGHAIKPAGVKQAAFQLTVDQRQAQQRIDNFLFNLLHNVPRSYVYRLIRSGQVRVNKGRIKQIYRLQPGDVVRIPPLLRAVDTTPAVSSVPEHLLRKLENIGLFENAQFWVINKPRGIAVHAGSKLAYGLIDALRQIRGELDFLELAHRLDRDTSGCMLLVKQREALLGVQRLMRQGQVEKEYLALLKGRLLQDEYIVRLPLRSNSLQSGQRLVVTDPQGKPAETHIQLLERFSEASLVRVKLMTGRKHQIRVHTASLGHPLAGDEKYGDRIFNRHMRSYGLQRMFLHAERLAWQLDVCIDVHAPLPEGLRDCLHRLPKL